MSDIFVQTHFHYTLLCSHDKALEAITVCGELEERGRFSKIVEALDDDHTNLKVRLNAYDIHITSIVSSEYSSGSS